MDSPEEVKILTEVELAIFYLLFSIQFVAAFLSVLLLFGLLIPLLIQLKNGTYQRRMARQSRGGEPPYSTYNLYLVYLAALDLAYLLPNMAAELITVNQNFRSKIYADIFYFGGSRDDLLPERDIPLIISGPYGIANIWLNAIIAYEILALLKASQRVQRITQPSLLRVNLQGGCVICGTILYSVFFYQVVRFGWLFSGLFLPVVSLLGVPPLVYTVGATILVHRRGYMPSANGSNAREKSIRGLAFYFFRIAAIFLVVWAPSGTLAALAVLSVGSRWSSCIALLLLALQPIFTFWTILSKPDAKKYIKDLVTLTYVFGESKRPSKNDKAVLASPRTSDTAKLGSFPGSAPDNDEHDPSDGGTNDAYEASTVFAPMARDDDKNSGNSCEGDNSTQV